MYVMLNFQKAFHMKKKKIPKIISDVEVNGVEVIMKQNAGIFALCSEIVWHLVLSETAPENNHKCKSLRLGQQREEPISVSIELEEISDISVCLQNSWGLLRHESN